jgi:hypothetical protein
MTNRVGMFYTSKIDLSGCVIIYPVATMGWRDSDI